MQSTVQVYQLLAASEAHRHHGLTVCFVTEEVAHLQDCLPALQLTEPRYTLVIVGGASGLDHRQAVQLDGLFKHVLAPLAEELQLYVVDGGTDAGVMQLMGRARAHIGGTFPLIGVAPRSLVSLPGEAMDHPQASTLEPYHTHCLLVPGDKWGDESVWMSTLATQLSRTYESMTVLINGGSVTLQDAQASIDAGREVAIIAGTGRAADQIVRALQNKEVEATSMAEERTEGDRLVTDPHVIDLINAAPNLLITMNLDESPAKFIQNLKSLLLE